MGLGIESLRTWSHLLFWLSVILPVLGVVAGVGRYYVDRQEKKMVVDTQNVETEKQRRGFERLKAETAPRKISDEQRVNLKKALLQTSGSNVIVASFMVDSESGDYADQIDSVLREAGWVSTVRKTSLNDFKGLGITCVTAKQQALSGYSELVASFSSEGIRMEPYQAREKSISGNLPDGTILIVIGRK
ncbi:hypothetical protein [Methyloglobulus sp.]|uniref:hypothetical protein n=1 Tax=Methyloglobulus sp. TaxID=2518622 RepID=UPI003989D455